jgi:DNA-binding NarL/FixJ family response regulator
VRALRDFAEANGIEVLDVAAERERALQLIAEHEPDLFVTETASSGYEEALALVRETRRLAPSLKIVLIGEGETPDCILTAVAAGADLYVFKNADPGDVAAAMRHAFRRPYYNQPAAFPRVPPGIGRRKAANGAEPVALTKREQEILRLVSEGHTNAAMASMLWLTEQTIKFHLSNLYRKLEVTNRTEAARWARDNGALPAAANVG